MARLESRLVRRSELATALGSSAGIFDGGSATTGGGTMFLFDGGAAS